MSMIKGGQQMSARVIGRAGSAQCLAVDRDHPPPAGSQGGALLGPAARRLIQGIGVQLLQGAAERGLTRHHGGDPERIPGPWSVSEGPFRDRRERPGTSQHGAYGQAQDDCQPVTHAPAGARIRNRSQHLQQPRRLLVQGLHGSQQLADCRVNRG